MVDAVRVLPRRSERLLDAGRDVPDHVQHSTNARAGTVISLPNPSSAVPSVTLTTVPCPSASTT